MTSNNCLDFADPDDDADTGIFRRKFYHCEIGIFFTNLLYCKKEGLFSLAEVCSLSDCLWLLNIFRN